MTDLSSVGKDDCELHSMFLLRGSSQVCEQKVNIAQHGSWLTCFAVE